MTTTCYKIITTTLPPLQMLNQSPTTTQLQASLRWRMMEVSDDIDWIESNEYLLTLCTKLVETSCNCFTRII